MSRGFKSLLLRQKMPINCFDLQAFFLFLNCFTRVFLQKVQTSNLHNPLQIRDAFYKGFQSVGRPLLHLLSNMPVHIQRESRSVVPEIPLSLHRPRPAALPLRKNALILFPLKMVLDGVYGSG